MSRHNRIGQRENLPIVVFGMVLGAAVWTLVLKAAHYIRGVPTG